MNGTCATCLNLPGCGLLIGKKVGFLVERVIEEENRERGDFCPKWQSTSDREDQFRQRMYSRIGPAYVQAIHAIPREQLEEREVFVPEEEEGDMSEVPDFAGMLRKGMSVKEREAQLRYETDEEGEVLLDEEDKPTPRGAFPLRQYAMDPEGPVKSLPDVVLFWRTNDLIRSILAKEKQLGLVLPNAKAKKKSQKKGAPEKARASKKEKRQKMPRKRIILTKEDEEETPAAGKKKRRGKKKAAKGNGKAEKPATNKRRAKPTSEEDDAPAAEFDVGAIKEIVKAELSPFKKALEKLDKNAKDRHDEAIEKLTQGLTVLHDVVLTKLNAEEDDPRCENLMKKNNEDSEDIFDYLNEDAGGDDDDDYEDDDEGNGDDDDD